MVELRAGPLLAGSLLLITVGSVSVRAQPPFKSDGERITLVVRPHVGDTLWLRLEQTIETRSVPVNETRSANGAIGSRAPASRRPEYGPVRDLSITQSTVMRLNAHSTVESSDLKVTGLNVVSDSLHLRTGTRGQLGPERPVQLSADNRRTRVNVTPDGAMSVLDARGATTTAIAAGLSAMPPMLPLKSVAVGEGWERDIPLPSIPMTGVQAEGVVHAQFRLDSLTKAGRFAYISLAGTLRREGAARDLPPGTQVATAGVLRGYLILDRTRGWITEAETVIEVQSDVTPRPGDAAQSRSLDIRLVQRMRVY
ncbi:MAG: hypothetical protein ABI852_02045 [Gemmatimonadaceae bacterium]